eukprot:9482890-Pyramimonas_sp.AAC.1
MHNSIDTTIAASLHCQPPYEASGGRRAPALGHAAAELGRRLSRGPADAARRARDARACVPK